MWMKLEDLSRMRVPELRQRASEVLAQLEGDGVGKLDQGPILSEAQFYIDEIERRNQSRTARRDLILEIVVIVLIGLELYFGITGGNQQLAVLQKMDKSAGQQLEDLQKLNTSADETARITKSLREEQDVALATQQQTLQMIVQMNGALQTQLGLNFSPALTLIYDESQKALIFQNLGKTNVFIWGEKWDGQAAATNPQPRIIAAGAAYKFPAEDILKTESLKLPKGASETVALDIYLKTANGKKYTSSYLVIPTWKNDVLTVNVQQVGIKPGNW
jgi:hypothetical protein